MVIIFMIAVQNQDESWPIVDTTIVIDKISATGVVDQYFRDCKESISKYSS